MSVVLATAMDGGNAATSVYVFQSTDTPCLGEEQNPTKAHFLFWVVISVQPEAGHMQHLLKCGYKRSHALQKKKDAAQGILICGTL